MREKSMLSRHTPFKYQSFRCLPSDHDAVHDVSDEVAPLGQRSRHQGGGRGSKHELEKPLGQLVR